MNNNISNAPAVQQQNQKTRLAGHYANVLLQQKTLKPNQRTELAFDYLQRYRNSGLLTDEEITEFNSHSWKMNLLSIGFAMCVPLSCIYIISGKRTSGAWIGPMIGYSTGTTSILGAMLWVTGSNQRLFLKSLELKYFSKMSD